MSFIINPYRFALPETVDEFIDDALMASYTNVAWFTATGFYNIAGTDDNTAARNTTANSEIIYNITNVTKVRLVWYHNNPPSFPAIPAVTKYVAGAWSATLTPTIFRATDTFAGSWVRKHWEFDGLSLATQIKLYRPATASGAWTPMFSDITFYGGSVS